MSARPLRILQVVEATCGGVGRHVADLCEELGARGHEVHLAYSPTRMDASFAARLPRPSRRVAIPMRRSPHTADLPALTRLVAYARRHGPFDAVHGHSSKGGALARLCGVAVGRPAIYTPNAFRTQDPDLTGLPFVVFRELERALAAVGAETIAVSEDERSHAVRLGLRADRVHVVHNGVPLDREAEHAWTREELGLPAHATIIGFVGRLTHQKAPERLIDAAASLERHDVHLAIVGDGPKEPGLREQARRLGIDARTHWLGPRDGFSAMALFDLLALPSRYEGLPYVLIEALIRGLPIVTSDVGGARETVRHGVNGFVVREGDAAELREALAALVGDGALRRRMAAEARARAPLFSLERMADRTLAVYETAFERSGAPPA